MHVSVNGVRLFFDVEGRHAVVPDAPERAMAVLRAFLARPK
jgi:hypothetical protein